MREVDVKLSGAKCKRKKKKNKMYNTQHTREKYVLSLKTFKELNSMRCVCVALRQILY